MGTTVTFNYQSDHASETVGPMVEQLRETDTFREIEARAAQNGFTEIDVYTVRQSTTNPGLAFVDKNGTPTITITTDQVFSAESFNPGAYNNPTSSRIVNIPTFSRQLPQGEMFSHELSHFALDHVNDGTVDIFFGGKILNEQEAIDLTNQLREELGLPLRIRHDLDGRSTGYYPFDPESQFDDQCFLYDTSVQMWPLDPSIKPRPDGSYDEELVLSKVWYKQQNQMQVNDWVVSHDKLGRMQPGRVSRTMTNTATHILDFWGTGVTPGHAYYCADGPFKDGYAPIMDVLRTDSVLKRSDGTTFRAATNCDVGSIGDRMIHAAATFQKPDGSWTEPKPGQIRFGTRISTPDGKKSTSVMDIVKSRGWGLSDDGYMIAMIKGEDGTAREEKFAFPYTHAKELPNPETYILTRSQVTLEEIYLASEWEQIGTRMPAPNSLAGFNPNSTMKRSKPKPNIPPAFANRPDAPTVENRIQHPAQPSHSPSMNRKQRKAMEAKQRKAAKMHRR